MNFTQALFKCQVHQGHHKSMTNPLMRKYLYGQRRGREIFDLQETIYHLSLCRLLITEVLKENAYILIHFSSEFEYQLLAPLIPKNSSIIYLRGSWVGGLLTNWSQLQSFPKQLDERKFKLLPTAKKKGLKRKFSPFLQLLSDGNLYSFGDDVVLPQPDLFFTFKVKGNETSLAEAAKMKIPSMGVLDSDADPRTVTYGIPGNDDSAKALYFYAQYLFSTHY